MSVFWLHVTDVAEWSRFGRIAVSFSPSGYTSRILWRDVKRGRLLVWL